MSDDGAVSGGGQRGERSWVGGPPTQDAASTVAVFQAVVDGGRVVHVPAVIWSTSRRLVEVVGATPEGHAETRDVEVGQYLAMGLELVGVGESVVPADGGQWTPGWRLLLDRASRTSTVLRPDGGVAITGPYDPRNPGEARVVDLWLAAVDAREAVLLLTGVIIFDGREPDLADAQHHGGLLRGVAAYSPSGREHDSQGENPVGRRWWRNLRTHRPS